MPLLHVTYVDSCALDLEMKCQCSCCWRFTLRGATTTTYNIGKAHPGEPTAKTGP